MYVPFQGWMPWADTHIPALNGPVILGGMIWEERSGFSMLKFRFRNSPQEAR